ncbi:MAG TPA: S66 peptidase family protein [Rubrobacteraceae bacterium]|nr:S66 peptidase family protein [Rubrobacteraceae bacterium]
MKPPRLREGDTVGVISPSWGGGAEYPHRVERGVEYLESSGFRVRIASHAMNSVGYVSDTAENRVSDIHAMFRDPEVRAIVSMIGGDHSCHLLPLLNFDLLRENPKILMGYSDVTVLNVAIWQMTGLVTFNGPALMVELAEYPEVLRYTERHMLKALCSAEPVGRVEPSAWWTEEFLDWDEKEDLTRARTGQASSGWTWLKGGRADGVLVGGCLESMQHLRGTTYWPDLDGAILFLETSEEKPDPERVDGILMDYENMGAFGHIKGLLFGRPYAYTPEEREQLNEIILERVKGYGFPVVADMDFGHTSPMYTLPVGCRAAIEPGRERFEIVEPAVS